MRTEQRVTNEGIFQLPWLSTYDRHHAAAAVLMIKLLFEQVVKEEVLRGPQRTASLGCLPLTLVPPLTRLWGSSSSVLSLREAREEEQWTVEWSEPQLRAPAGISRPAPHWQIGGLTLRALWEASCNEKSSRLNPIQLTLSLSFPAFLFLK